MRFKKAAAAGLGLALVAGLCACGGPSTGTDYGATVGVVLPTNGESRWPMAEAQLKAAMPGVTISYSNNDTNIEKTSVESLIARGVKIIILCPVNGTTAASEVDEAHANGITVIAYDRLVMNTPNLDYYVTFDSIAVGEAQAQFLVDNATGTGNNLYLYAGKPADNNSFLFFQGSWNVLQPKIADGTFTIANSSTANSLKDKPTLTRDEMSQIIGQVTTNWSQTDAKILAQANLAAASPAQKGKVFLLTPNDDTSRAISDAFRDDPAVTTIYNTGQDLAQASAQYILDGKQSMTVFKNDKYLVNYSTSIVNAVLSGTTATTDTTYDNGSAMIPTATAPLVIARKDNIVSVIQGSGLYKIDNGQVVKL